IEVVLPGLRRSWQREPERGEGESVETPSMHAGSEEMGSQETQDERTAQRILRHFPVSRIAAGSTWRDRQGSREVSRHLGLHQGCELWAVGVGCRTATRLLASRCILGLSAS